MPVTVAVGVSVIVTEGVIVATSVAVPVATGVAVAGVGVTFTPSHSPSVSPWRMCAGSALRLTWIVWEPPLPVT